MPKVQIRPAEPVGDAVALRVRRPADVVTTTRLLLTCLLGALVVGDLAARPQAPVPTGWLVGLATAALLLDAVDGHVARRTGTCTAFGARYDMEADALLVLVLSVHVAWTVAWWVLLIGLARYLLLAAGWWWPWLRADTPPRLWAKVVAVVQGVVLVVAVSGVLPRPAILGLLGVALALLAESFGHQVRQLWRLRPPSPEASPEGGREQGPDHRPSRATARAAATGAAYAVVWLALVAPDRVGDLSPAAFARVPLELVALVVLALLLPARVRRPAGVALGVLLTLVVVVRALDLGFTAVLDRRFDLLNDSYYLAPALGVVRDSSGTAAVVGLVAGVVVLAALLLALLTASVTRVLATAARRRRVGAAAVAGLTLVAAFSAATGGEVASTVAAQIAGRQVVGIRADLADRRVFERAIEDDDPLPAGLLARLRGKDVLLVFVESYGRVAVQGSSFSPGVRAVLRRGTEQLEAAGYGARSGFLTSPTFGAASWLAHATLQSGLWVDSQQRYDQLVTARRTTLTSAFASAGWRTVFDVPAVTKDWADGRRFYGFDRLYDARNVGYRGRRFSYAPMPDQFTLAALERSELTPGVRRPVMAEVDLVSSHHPWTPLPRLVDWAEVGDGSVFADLPAEGGSPDAVLRDPDRVRAAYGRSIEYTWSALVSWLVRRHDPNLVLVVLGDHQPHSYVTGPRPGHDVPVSVIAGDPALLGPVDAWGWDAGLLPSPGAPVSRMDAFRDRFLAAFSDPALEGSTP